MYKSIITKASKNHYSLSGLISYMVAESWHAEKKP